MDISDSTGIQRIPRNEIQGTCTGFHVNLILLILND